MTKTQLLCVGTRLYSLTSQGEMALPIAFHLADIKHEDKQIPHINSSKRLFELL
jgi:hypothetical protein